MHSTIVLLMFSLHTQQPQVLFLAFTEFFWSNFSERIKCLDEKIVDVARLINSAAAKSCGLWTA